MKRKVLRRWRNVVSDWADVVSSGSKFQMRGPATVKARLPTVESLTGGTRRRLVSAERSVRRPGRSLTSASGPRYRGAVLWSTLYVNTATLYSIREGRAASEEWQARQWCDPRIAYDTSAVQQRSVLTVGGVL